LLELVEEALLATVEIGGDARMNRQDRYEAGKPLVDRVRLVNGEGAWGAFGQENPFYGVRRNSVTVRIVSKVCSL
jgi:hypothetical protein